VGRGGESERVRVTGVKVAGGRLRGGEGGEQRERLGRGGGDGGRCGGGDMGRGGRRG